MATQILYSDIDLMFKIHPVKKDLVLSTNEQAIVRSIKNLILTNHYERPFQAGVGSNVRKMLFEPFSPLTANYIEKEIYDVIKIYEPRVTGLVVKVVTSVDESVLNATIQFYLNNQTNLTRIDMLLERLR
jgi:phage baseplate assembly protein W